MLSTMWKNVNCFRSQIIRMLNVRPTGQTNKPTMPNAQSRQSLTDETSMKHFPDVKTGHVIDPYRPPFEFLLTIRKWYLTTIHQSQSDHPSTDLDGIGWLISWILKTWEWSHHIFRLLVSSVVVLKSKTRNTFLGITQAIRWAWVSYSGISIIGLTEARMWLLVRRSHAWHANAVRMPHWKGNSVAGKN